MYHGSLQFLYIRNLIYKHKDSILKIYKKIWYDLSESNESKLSHNQNRQKGASCLYLFAREDLQKQAHGVIHEEQILFYIHLRAWLLDRKELTKHTPFPLGKIFSFFLQVWASQNCRLKKSKIEFQVQKLNEEKLVIKDH